MNNKLLISTLLTVGLIGASALQAAEKTQRGLYLGLFGGGSGSDNNGFTQSGVAHKINGQAGDHATYDLQVNVKGASKNETGAIGGLHIGYEWSEIPMGSSQSGWGLRPALEFEGYYLGRQVSGDLANSRLEPAIGDRTHDIAAGVHTFRDSFNVDMGILLVNSVFTFKTPWADKIYPYFGGGVGAAITSMSGANSIQKGPVYESTINHFNSNPSASDSSFAVQGKTGIRAEIVDHLSVFAEYRYLHVAATNYTFGSTVYPGVHSATSNWDSHFGSMNFHSGIFGIEYGF